MGAGADVAPSWLARSELGREYEGGERERGEEEEDGYWKGEDKEFSTEGTL